MKINPRLFLFLLASGSCCFQLQATLTEYQTAVKNEASLIAYYTFDAGNANDSKATYHGTAAGTVAYDTGVGLGTDKALILSGAGHINLGEVEPFNFASGSGTIEAWIRADWTTSPGYNPAIFADRDDAPVNWSLHMNSGKDGIGLWNGSTYQPLTIGSGGARTAWHHFAAVFELNPSTGEPTFTEYWDGNPLGTTPQGLGAAPESPTELGSSSAAGTERWRGGLDEVAFYSQALSADAIKAHYTAFLVGEKPTILTAPAGGNFLAGIPLTLSVSAKGAQLSYQWLKNGAALTAATNATLTFPQLSAGDAGSYTVTVSNPAGQVTSTGAIVAIGTLPAKLTQYQAAVRAEPSLISYYTFDQVNANDSKAANHGTVQGTVQFLEGVGGGAGKALVMDGSGHINLGQVDALDFATGTGTIEAWVRADWTGGVGYNGAIFADRDGGPVNWSIHMNDAKDGVGLWNGSSYEPQPTPGTGTAWHHLAAVFGSDPATGEPAFTIYWDGQPAGTTAQGLGSVPEAPTELGSSAPSGQERWVGGLDEVAFYSAALSAADILRHYATFATGNPPVITVQPAGGVFFAGDPLNLTVGVQGVDVAYQWSKNGSALNGATNATLAFAALTAADSGTYRVRVSNAAGNSDSDNVTVTASAPDLARYQGVVRAEASLISYYSFDRSDATDSKGNNNGTVEGTVAYLTGVGAGTDKALVIDGSGHIDLGQVAAFDFTSGRGSVEAWIRADWTNPPSYNPAIFADRDGAPVNWSVHMNAGKEAGGLWNGSSYSPLPLVRTGITWHHLVVVFNRDAAGSSSFTLYWDGQAAGVTTQPLGAAPESPTELGSSAVSGAEYWLGALDEVAFYSAALSAQDVQRHFQALLAGAPQTIELALSRSGNQLTVSWPGEVAGYVLEFSPELVGGAWTPVSNVTGNSATVTIGNGNGFYRLRQP